MRLFILSLLLSAGIACAQYQPKFPTTLPASGGTATTISGTLPASQVTGINTETQTALDGKLAVGVVDGSGLYNVTGRHGFLPYLTKKLTTSGTKNYRFVFLGDSFMSASTGGDVQLTNGLISRLGPQAGVCMINGTYSGEYSVSTSDIATWVTGVTVSISGTTGMVGYTANDALPFVMDTIRYYAIASPGAGTFKLQYSLSGTGAWTDMTGTINTSGTLGAMVVTGTLPSRASYLTRAVSLSGTSKFVGALGYDSTATGPIFAYLDRGGIAANQLAANVPASILNPVLADLAPDCYIWGTALVASQHTDDPDFSNFFARFNAGYTADWVVVSGHPQSDSATDVAMQQSTATLRETCVSRDYYFFDKYRLFGTWARRQAIWGAADGIHCNAAENNYWTDALLGTNVFSNGDTLNPTALAGTVPDEKLSTIRDITNVVGREVGISSKTDAYWSYTADDGQPTGIYWRSPSGSIRANLYKYAHSQSYYPDALEFRGWTSPYGITMIMADGKFWTGLTRPSATPTHQFRVNDGTSYFGGTVQTGSGGTPVSAIVSATATLDFSSIAAASQADLTITVTGAAGGDVVSLGLPSAPAGGIVFNAFVSATNTVTIRATNVTGSAVDPASAIYRVQVTKF